MRQVQAWQRECDAPLWILSTGVTLYDLRVPVRSFTRNVVEPLESPIAMTYMRIYKFVRRQLKPLRPPPRPTLFSACALPSSIQFSRVNVRHQPPRAVTTRYPFALFPARWCRHSLRGFPSFTISAPKDGDGDLNEIRIETA